MTRKSRDTIVLLAYVAFMNALFMAPVDDIEGSSWMTRLHVDKVVHGVLFFVCAWLLVRWGRRHTRLGRLPAVFLALALCAGCAAGTEQMQRLSSFHASDWLDFIADVIGALAGAAAAFLLPLRDRPRRPSGSPPDAA